MQTRLVSKIRSEYNSFTNSERKVAEYVLIHAEFVPTMTTKQLAVQANASEASIVRFCKRIGMESFRMLKVALAQELSQMDASINSLSLLESSDTSHSLFQKVTSLNRASLDMMTKTVNHQSFEKAVKLISQAKTVGLFGVGGSFTPAVDGQYKFMRLGLHASASSDYHYIIPFITMMKKHDVLICFSTSGYTKEVVDTANYAQKKNLTVISITKYANSPLVKHSDYVLAIPDIEQSGRIGSIASRTSQLNYIDALYVAVFHLIGEELVEAFEQARETTEEHRKL
ncbi:MurR/RpiR family transcriptional regulator [Marinococcus halophilus]|uniref:RpiR family transcriptional regulator n=1 Tax=Marinococcus halophilus TaxID=1371 RepID=A0A510Y3V7_MARHA|nr:MurR/RpiR family transcriptional regulator [Marinococcus halophilus]OZT80925.1 MurR/RpiR family transcriptional regulator [Marinococcus halophilus]GEK57984.1 RpiR family transcriptional regulator [Marinococcus halophilus]